MSRGYYTHGPIPLTAEAAIAPNLFVKLGTAANSGTVGTGLAIGVYVGPGTVAIGETFDTYLNGAYPVRCAANLTKGTAVKPNASGQAIAATTGGDLAAGVLIEAGATGGLALVKLSNFQVGS